MEQAQKQNRPSRRERKRRAAEALRARELEEEIASATTVDFVVPSAAAIEPDVTTRIAPREQPQRAGAYGTTSFWTVVVILILLAVDYGFLAATNIHDRIYSGEHVKVPGKLVRGYEAYSQLVDDITQLAHIPENRRSMLLTSHQDKTIPEAYPIRRPLRRLRWRGFKETEMLRDSGRNAILNVLDAMEGNHQRGILRFINGITSPPEVVEAAILELKNLRDKTETFFERDLATLKNYAREVEVLYLGRANHLERREKHWHNLATDTEGGWTLPYRIPVIARLRYIAQRINEAQAASFDKFRPIAEKKNIIMILPTGQPLFARAALRVADIIANWNPVFSAEDQARIKDFRWYGTHLGQLKDLLRITNKERDPVGTIKKLAERMAAFREEFKDPVSPIAITPSINSPPYSYAAFNLALRPLLIQLCRLSKWSKCEEYNIDCREASEVEENYGRSSRFALVDWRRMEHSKYTRRSIGFWKRVEDLLGINTQTYYYAGLDPW